MGGGKRERRGSVCILCDRSLFPHTPPKHFLLKIFTSQFICQFSKPEIASPFKCAKRVRFYGKRMDTRGPKEPVSWLRNSTKFGGGTVHVCRSERSVGERSSLEGLGWVGLPFLEDPHSQEGLARCLRLSVRGTPLQAIAHQAASSKAPTSGRSAGRWEVGGSTAWRLPQRLTVFPLAPWRPLTPGSPAIRPREAG